MAKPTAAVDYTICDIQKCSKDGVCIACKHCKNKVLRQEEPGQPPFQLGPCQGCSSCLTACPLKAIRLI
jgi:MinD superfamily P-loop ATPase